MKLVIMIAYASVCHEAISEEVHAASVLYSWNIQETGRPPGTPLGVVVDGAGHVFVSDVGNARILRYSSQGELQLGWGEFGGLPGQLSWGGQAAITDEGNLLAVDYYRVQEYTTSGSFVRELGHDLESITFNGVHAVAISLNNEILVCDTNHDRIVTLSRAGQYLSTWGSSGNGDVQFYKPTGISVSPSGHVYVVDWGNNRVQKLNADGEFILSWGSFGSGPGQMSGPIGVATGTQGRIYITDTGNDRVQVFDELGGFLGAWGSPGGEPGQFRGPTGIYVDSNDLVYVADRDNLRIQVFDSVVPTDQTTWSKIKLHGLITR